MNIYIYLSGNVPKSHANEGSFVWTNANMDMARSLFAEKGEKIIFLNPLSRTDDLSNIQSLFGRDLLQVYLSNCVLVDAREKRGVGVGYEMAFANFKRIPVVSWVPYGSHYRAREMEMLGQKLHDWEHPFLRMPSIQLVDTLSDAIEVIANLPVTIPLPVTTEEPAFTAMQYYIDSNLERDREMFELIMADPKLCEKLVRIGIVLPTTIPTV